MNNFKAKLISILAIIALFFISYGNTHVFASEKISVKIVDPGKTIFSGDVSVDSGCQVKDEANAVHTFTSPFAVCALDSAAKSGNFSYGLKDLGEERLAIDQIAEDKNTADSSISWSYELNGQAAQQKISNLVLKDSDSLLFEFVNSNAGLNQEAVNSGISFLKSQQNPDGSIRGFAGINPWASIAFSSAGITNDALVNYLSLNPPATSSAATDWEKDILAITAAGKNPFDFGGVNYEAHLETFYNNSQLGSQSQINDDIFGLLALIASGPSASGSIKQDCLSFILAHQNNDGGFSWSTTGTSDADDTAAALQALAAAGNSGMSAKGLTDSIGRATIFLLSEQRNDGGFVSVSSDANSNTATTSLSVMALSALGMTQDAKTKNALNFVIGNQQKDGSFAWQAKQSGETFTTSYAVSALTGKSLPVEIFSQIISQTPTPTPTPTLTPLPTEIQSASDLPAESETPTPALSPKISPFPTQNVSETVLNAKNSSSISTTPVENSGKQPQNFQTIKQHNLSILEEIQKIFQEIDKRIKLWLHL